MARSLLQQHSLLVFLCSVSLLGVGTFATVTSVGPQRLGTCSCTRGTCYEYGQSVNVRSYCRCDPGLELAFHSTSNCTDIDECSLGVHRCHASAQCTNTDASYVCSCGAGHTSSANSTACTPMDPCSAYCPLPREICVSTAGASVPSCECANGFVRLPLDASNNCQDKDECLDGLPVMCPAHAPCRNTPGSYECSCPVGYRYDNTTGNCSNVNECTARTHDCHHFATCTDTAGSFTCQCPAHTFGDGRTYCQRLDCRDSPGQCTALHPHSHCDVTRKACVCDAGYFSLPAPGQQQHYYDSINCTHHTHACSYTQCPAHQRCVPDATSPLGHQCLCQDGYASIAITVSASGATTTNTRYCHNVDECYTRLSNCSRHANCTDTIGSYVCSCASGFTGDGVACFPLDPCSATTGTSLPALHGCRDDEVCQPSGAITLIVSDSGGSAGSQQLGAPQYSCVCRPGYRRNGSNGTTARCQNVNECTEPAMAPLCISPNTMCTDTNGSYVCACADGFQRVNSSCVNTDECAAGTHTCRHVYGKCTDTRGSYTCSCDSGFVGDGMTKCSDENECGQQMKPQACPTNSRCENTYGSYFCKCHAGYRGNASHCENVDECAEGGHNCDPTNGVCIDRPGTFDCQCSPGYSGTMQCFDTDECAGQNPCHAVTGGNATCENTIGSYTCNCSAGYGRHGNASGACQNVNECMETPAVCDTTSGATCVDSEGSYSCRCAVGMWLSTAAGVGTCQDVDECFHLAYKCGSTATCVNTVGAYHCQCIHGYNRIGSPDAAVGPCLNTDECSQGTHNCSAVGGFCSDNPGSYTCVCYQGYMGAGCYQDVSECALGTHDCDAHTTRCNEVFGSFSCNCRDGFAYPDADGRRCWATQCEKNHMPCDHNAECVTVGTSQHQCRCLPGFRGDGRSCVAITAPPTTPSTTQLPTTSGVALYCNEVSESVSGLGTFVWPRTQLGATATLDCPKTVAGLPSRVSRRCVAVGDRRAPRWDGGEEVTLACPGREQATQKLQKLAVQISQFNASNATVTTILDVTKGTQAAVKNVTRFDSAGIQAVSTVLDTVQSQATALLQRTAATTDLTDPVAVEKATLETEEVLHSFALTVSDVIGKTSIVGPTITPMDAPVGAGAPSYGGGSGDGFSGEVDSTTPAKTGNKITASLEQLVQNLPLLNVDKPIVVSTPTIAVATVCPGHTASGYSMTYQGGGGSSELSGIRLLEGVRSSGTDASAQFSIPAEAFQIANSIMPSNQRGMNGNTSTASNATLGCRRAQPSFIVYARGDLFNDNSLSPNYTISSVVVSAKVGALRNVSFANDKAVYSIQTILAPSSNRSACVHWDRVTLSWSSSGCKVLSTTVGSVTCQCNHLTNFAILVRNPSSSAVQGTVHGRVLRTVTIIGCVMSMIGLALTALSGIVLKELRGRLHFRLMTIMSIALLLACLFFTIIAVHHARLSVFSCQVLGLLLHLSLLSAFGWMMAQAALVYKHLVVVFGTDHSFMQKFAWMCITAPLLVVLVTASVSEMEAYDYDSFCWFSKPVYMYSGFIAPLAIMLLFNGSVLLLVSKNLMMKSRREMSPLSRMRIILSLTVLVGGTWLVGVVVLTVESVALQYIFTVLNAFQGLMVFLLNMATATEIRRRWVRTMRAIFCRRTTTASKNISGNSIASRVSRGSRRSNASYLSAFSFRRSHSAHNMAIHCVGGRRSNSNSNSSLNHVTLPSGGLALGTPLPKHRTPAALMSDTTSWRTNSSEELKTRASIDSGDAAMAATKVPYTQPGEIDSGIGERMSNLSYLNFTDMGRPNLLRHTPTAGDAFDHDEFTEETTQHTCHDWTESPPGEDVGRHRPTSSHCLYASEFVFFNDGHETAITSQSSPASFFDGGKARRLPDPVRTMGTCPTQMQSDDFCLSPLFFDTSASSLNTTDSGFEAPNTSPYDGPLRGTLLAANGREGEAGGAASLPPSYDRVTIRLAPTPLAARGNRASESDG
ncbi:uncharacterized protein LOC135828460 [Sycon ciliatum]|uniref:uncharacterized protein LOC135828460 n=1 Tax=Sycon ciliatum TaxID=27933 RepID=UPI0031F5FC88